MNNDLEQTLTGYERVQLTREQVASAGGYREAEKYGAIRADVAPDIVKSLIEGNTPEIKLIRASEFPCPDELQTFLEKHHPGASEKYWRESTNDETLHYDCKSDVDDYKRRYFVFVRKRS